MDLSTYPNDAEPSIEFPIYSRGNVGEAFPNVISPMSGSLMLEASARSQTRFFLAMGALSRSQIEDPRNQVFVQFGGYLYANISMVRIAPQTDPAWTPLFLGAAGVVVERGAVMSHAAIVARELGIPAVVGIERVTELIATGMQIDIDGSSGTVTIG